MNNLNELYEAILAGKLEQAVSVTREAVAGGAAPQEIINEYMIKAMEAIGARFESGQVFVPNPLDECPCHAWCPRYTQTTDARAGQFVYRSDCDWYGKRGFA